MNLHRKQKITEKSAFENIFQHKISVGISSRAEIFITLVAH